MQLGMIGLGRMGGNIVRRLMKNGHTTVVFDKDPKAVAALAADGSVGATALEDFVDSAELDAAESTGDFREAIVEADFGVVEPACARLTGLIAQTPQASGVSRVAGEDGAAFAGGELLVGVEAEDRQVPRAARTLRGGRIAVFCADGFAGIFDD